MDKYYELKLNPKLPDTLEIFLIFKDKNLYSIIKNNFWKKHDAELVSLFKGYNDKHMAMKFSLILEHEDKTMLIGEKIKNMLNTQISIYEITNISYEQFEEISEKRKRENYKAFMDGLKGL